jgi:alkylhydroperoxidase/carboxymuconolactone decarboxylase family protein YurZ
MTENITINTETAVKATEAAVDALMGHFVPALVKAGVTQKQIREALDSMKAANDNA